MNPLLTNSTNDIPQFITILLVKFHFLHITQIQSYLNVNQFVFVSFYPQLNQQPFIKLTRYARRNKKSFRTLVCGRRPQDPDCVVSGSVQLSIFSTRTFPKSQSHGFNLLNFSFVSVNNLSA